MFTMFPLLIRDGLRIPYFAVCAIFLCIYSLYIESKRIEAGLEEDGNIIKKLKMKKADGGIFPVRYVTLNRIAALFIFLSYAG